MRQVFDGEKATPSIARLKHASHTFEIMIDPDGALNVRKKTGDIHAALLAPRIYKDVNTGEIASAELMQEIFKTTDELKVAEKIIIDGELHFNEEYKDKMRNEKKAHIISILSREAADANTGLPVTEQKLHAALGNAKVHIDLYKSVEEQMPDIIARLRSVINLTLEKKTVSLRVPSKFAPKLYGLISSRSNIIEQAWLGDGALSAKVELSAGAVSGFLDELKKATHGDIEANIEAKKSEARKN